MPNRLLGPLRAASEVRSGSDLSVDAQDAEGVLTSDRITETDILDGRWDNGEVEVWRVNWTDTSQRVLMRRGAIGQIRRGRLAFVERSGEITGKAIAGAGGVDRRDLDGGNAGFLACAGLDPACAFGPAGDEKVHARRVRSQFRGQLLVLEPVHHEDIDVRQDRFHG